MKLPVSMLRNFVETPLTANELGDLLTMAGFELEGTEGTNDDAVLDIKVMANRGDGLSALGLAREVLAKDASSKPTDLYQRACQYFPATDSGDPGVSITIDTDSCTRYAARLFDDVENGASPAWLTECLARAGQRPISLLVDLTNFVMLELGQPLHAFDLDKLQGQAIVVRNPNQGETLKTLNGEVHELKPHHMMICDAVRPVAVAGVMGGEATEVGPYTRRMLLESAHFVNTSVRKTRKELGLSTDASYRFERSVDPNGVVAALNRFEELYAEITGKRSRPGVTDVYGCPPNIEPISFRPARAARLLGMEVTPDQCETYLTKLGFRVGRTGDEWIVAPPSWRPDAVAEEDLTEEIGRVHGYELIPELLPQGTTPRGGTFGLYSIIDTAKKTMLRCGLDQMISHSLRDRHPLDFDPTRFVSVRNPHSPEMAYLRNSLLPGLAEAALRNGGKNVRLFEIGKVFVQGQYQKDESPELAVLISGEMQDPHFAMKSPPVADFWALKGIVMELGKLIKDDVTFLLPRDPDRRFHPTRQSGVLVDQGRLWVGTIGQIHPLVAEEVGLPLETYMAELDLLVFFQNPDIEIPIRQISRNPAVRRDIAFTIKKEVPFRTLRMAIRAACGDVLERDWLFDVYEGKGIPEGEHSLAIALQLRKMGENFTDEEANSVRDLAIGAVRELGGVLR